MLNPLAAEAIVSATYVDNYIDSVENLPDDVQRHLSRIRDIDVQYRSHLHDVDKYYGKWKSITPAVENAAFRRGRNMKRIQQSLISARELSDEKMQIVNQLQELIDLKIRQLDTDQKNLNYGRENQSANEIPAKIARTTSPIPAQLSGAAAIKHENQYSSSFNNIASGSGNNTTTSQQAERTTQNQNTNNNNSNETRTNKRSRRPRNDTSNQKDNHPVDAGGTESNSATEGNSQTGGHKGGATNQNSSTGNTTSHKKTGGSNAKKKKRKARGQNNSHANAKEREETPPPDPIDPDEPTYCLCDQVSFGEMILCDNDLCPIEWFHFSCVSLTTKPKGKWYCPNCRGDRPNVMKPKALFLKELERYNKEREEKT